jgi:hypothetical protein
VPVTFKVKVPTGVFLVVKTVKTVFPDPVTVVGLKLPVAFAGKPLIPNVTTPLNPFTAFTLAV